MAYGPKKMAKAGGTKRKQLIKEWEESFWPLTIDSEEMSKQLLRQKRNERSKHQKVQGEAAELRKVTKEQEKTIASLHGGIGQRASHKSWQE